jgi:hypothetical protein
MNRTSIAPAAAVSAVIAAALAAWGTFGHESGAVHAVEEGGDGVGEYLVVLAIIAVGALAVFGWAVPRSAGSPAAGRTALVLGVLGVLSIAAFWSGLPPVLATGAAVLGWTARDRLAGRAAIALGVLAIAADVIVYITDMT